MHTTSIPTVTRFRTASPSTAPANKRSASSASARILAGGSHNSPDSNWVAGKAASQTTEHDRISRGWHQQQNSFFHRVLHKSSHGDQLIPGPLSIFFFFSFFSCSPCHIHSDSVALTCSCVSALINTNNVNITNVNNTQTSHSHTPWEDPRPRPSR